MNYAAYVTVLVTAIDFEWVRVMRNRWNRKYTPLVCLIMGGLYAHSANAGWSGSSFNGSGNHKYGDFPPLDIDKQLQESMSAGGKTEDNLSQHKAPAQDSNAGGSNSNQLVIPAKPNAALPAYGGNQPGQALSPYSKDIKKVKKTKKAKKKRKSGFGSPWNNGSGFSMPWGNRNSGASLPWDKNSSFSGPWDKNGSSFSFPWDNNGSGFTPWGGKRRHR